MMFTDLLDIFASTYPSYEMCQKQEATKYINVCRFKINCADIDKVESWIIFDLANINKRVNCEQYFNWSKSYVCFLSEKCCENHSTFYNEN